MRGDGQATQAGAGDALTNLSLLLLLSDDITRTRAAAAGGRVSVCTATAATRGRRILRRRGPLARARRRTVSDYYCCY